MEPSDGSSISQLRRGVLEYCVLALLRDTERYSYEIVHALSQVEGLVTSEGTLVIPGGYAAAFAVLLAAGGTHGCLAPPGHICTDGPTPVATIGQVVLVVLVFDGPLAAAFYLANRTRQKH